MDPAVLAWALAQPAGSRAQMLAAAYTGGTTRVSFEGRTVEYRSLDELGRALAVLRATVCFGGTPQAGLVSHRDSVPPQASEATVTNLTQ